MKKITLLFALLISTAGFSQELVTNGDFQTGVNSPWYGEAANVVELSTGAFYNQAEVTTKVAAYLVNLSQEILLSDGVTYTLTFDAFTDDATGSRTMLAGLGQTGSPWLNSQETVTLTSTLQTFTYTFTINYGDAVTDRVFFDMGADLGFVFIDNVSVKEFVDTTAPADFTASAGTISAFSVELVLNATDDSGNVTYDVAYTNSGAQTATMTGVSAQATSLVISNLTPQTAYSFTVSASDAAGNTATNNPITVSATTVADTSTACAGTSSDVSEGTLNGTYDYSFETLTNGDVRMTFELGTAVTGLVAYAWRETPFQETSMTVTGNVATIDLTGLTSGNDISYAVKFSWANSGLAVTKYFTYTVGNDCSTAGLDGPSLSSIKMHPNPASGVLKFTRATTELLNVSVYDLLGKQVMPAQTIQSELNISSLNPGMYFVRMEQGASSLTKKLIVK